MTSYLDDMDQVLPNLWIGGFPSVKRLKLNVNNIQSILSVVTGKVNIPEGFNWLRIPLDDREDADILAHLSPSIAFIQNELCQGKRVLVHCQAGISRSSTIVAAYLMYTQRLDRDAALALIREARPGIRPNDGFMAQLEIFHRGGCRISDQDKATRKFYASRRAMQILNGDSTAPQTTSMLPDYPISQADSLSDSGSLSSPAEHPRRRIRCKMCRQGLATGEHISEHGQPVSLTTAKDTSSSILTSQDCSGYFLEPMKWMEPFLNQGQLSGKILCPNEKCGVKLGNYDWAGVRCGCKEWVTPGFCISRSKVDEMV